MKRNGFTWNAHHVVPINGIKSVAENLVICESINVVVSSGKGCAALIKGVRQDALFIANEKDVITCDGGEE